jgi:solute carrier family 6 GABA transporter-like protein 1
MMFLSCLLQKGVGFGAAVMAFWLDIYYIVMLSWALFYLIQSMSASKSGILLNPHSGTLLWS